FKSKTAKAIYGKYYVSFVDGFRWSMKPVLMQYLIEERGMQKVFCIDCDGQFYSNYNFLFELLDKYRSVVSPHNRCKDPEVDPVNFIKNFNEGIYNGGFVAASDKAVEILDWWAKACLFECKVSFQDGLFVDQKYLDLIP